MAARPSWGRARHSGISRDAFDAYLLKETDENGDRMEWADDDVKVLRRSWSKVFPFFSFFFSFRFSFLTMDQEC